MSDSGWSDVWEEDTAVIGLSDDGVDSSYSEFLIQSLGVSSTFIDVMHSKGVRDFKTLEAFLCRTFAQIVAIMGIRDMQSNRQPLLRVLVLALYFRETAVHHGQPLSSVGDNFDQAFYSMSFAAHRNAIISEINVAVRSQLRANQPQPYTPIPYGMPSKLHNPTPQTDITSDEAHSRFPTATSPSLLQDHGTPPSRVPPQ